MNWTELVEISFDSYVTDENEESSIRLIEHCSTDRIADRHAFNLLVVGQVLGIECFVSCCDVRSHDERVMKTEAVSRLNI